LSLGIGQRSAVGPVAARFVGYDFPPEQMPDLNTFINSTEPTLLVQQGRWVAVLLLWLVGGLLIGAVVWRCGFSNPRLLQPGSAEFSLLGGGKSCGTMPHLRGQRAQRCGSRWRKSAGACNM
jgi:hypothetical protein